MADRLSFDEWYGEHVAPPAPIPVSAFGEDFELPGEMPTHARLVFERIITKEGEIPEGMIRDALVSLAGRERVDRWFGPDVAASMRKLGTFLSFAIDAYATERAKRGGTPPGEAQAPTPGHSPMATSSTSGPTSAPTSLASTTSI